uniref:[histone H3]-lysine(4) N-trimethyltransferase n=1 Tax=Strongyloides stercoralis TaxID=6248 RepID=A0AAF5HXP0_STRER
MESSFFNVPTFCSEDNDSYDGKSNGNWTLLNQVYEKIAENEEEQKKKKKKTNKNECIPKESCSNEIYHKDLKPFFNNNVNISDNKVDEVQQNKDASGGKNIILAYKSYNDLNSFSTTNNLLDCQFRKKKNFQSFNNSIISNKPINKQKLRIKMLPNGSIKRKIQLNYVNTNSTFDSSLSKSTLSIKFKHDNVSTKSNLKEEIYTCARLQPYNNLKKNVEDINVISSGIKNNRDLISFPELPVSSLKHKRKITNSDILDPEVHGHAISKRAIVETSAYSRYQIMVSEWRHYVKMVKSKVHGFGLIANVDIPENTYIIEYTGEQIRYEIANIREKKYIKSGLGVYFFQIDSDYVVDATFYGSCSRYMNHSCEANCIAHIIFINEKKKIIMISSRDIKKGEELVYDYKFEKEEGSKNRIPCYCGAKKCKKWIN